MKNCLLFLSILSFSYAQAQHFSDFFKKNAGQIFDMDGNARPDILFYKESADVDMFFLNDRISYVFKKTEKFESENDSIQTAYYRIDWLLDKANLTQVEPINAKRLPLNFYKGDVKIQGLLSAKKIAYRDIYEGVDLIFYLSDGAVKYDFIVQNEGGLKKISSKIEGAESILNENGDLLLKSEAGIITDKAPISFDKNGEILASSFAVSDDEIKYNVEENGLFPIRIDPEVVFSTFFGGNNNNEYARGVALDDSSNTYVTGQAASTNFPTTTGAFQTRLNRGSSTSASDAFIAKIYPNGKLAWSTLYGGGSIDYATDIDVDLNGIVHITGLTASNDFPTTSNAYDGSLNGFQNDAFYVKLKNDGSQLYGSFLGGTSNQQAWGISVSHTFQTYVYGFTTSNNFPTTSGAYQTSLAGNYDNFITKFDYDGDIAWSTYFGGQNFESNAGDIAAANSGKFVAFTGQTGSKNFPTKNAWQDSLATPQQFNQQDAFVVKLDSTGGLEWSTYLGGTAYDTGLGIDFMSDGKVVLAGQHNNSAFPTKGKQFANLGTGFQNAWLAIFTADGYPTKISTWGGNRQEDIYDLAVDSLDKIHFSGFTNSSNLPKTADAFQKKNASFLISSDLYYTICDSNLNIEYCTYIGGTASYEYQPSIDVDPDRNFVLAAGSNGNDYPTKNALQNSNNNFNDAVITKFTCNYEPTLNVSNWADTICRGDSLVLEVDSNLKKYTWEGLFETGNRVALKNKGEYFVNVEDSNGCSGGTDTFFLSLFRSVNPTIAANGATTVCDDESVKLEATTKWADSWKWNSGQTKKNINVTKTGDYFLLTTDSNKCVDTSNTINVKVIPKPYPAISSNTGATNFCNKYKQITLDAGKGYNAYQWSTGATTQDITVTKTGWYSVRVYNGLGCSEIDSVFVQNTRQQNLIIGSQANIKFCKEDSVLFTAPDDFTDLIWHNGSRADSIYVNKQENVFVVGRDSNGCLDTSNIIRVSPIASSVSIKLSQTQPFCANDTIGLSIDTGLVDYKWATGDSSNSIKISTSGQYWATATSAQGCNIFSDTVSIQMLPQQSVTLSYTGKPEICENESFNLSFKTNSFSSFKWSNGDSTNTNLSLTKGGDYFVAITDTNGCMSYSDSIKLVVNQLPQVFLSASNGTSFCDKDSTVLNANRSFSAYDWSNGSNAKSVSIKKAGNYWLRVKDAKGCENNSDTLAIQVKALPDTAINIIGNTEFCDKDSVVIELNLNPQNILWTNGSGNSKITIKQSVKIKATLTAANGCVDSTREVAVTVNPNPQPKLQLSGSQAFCKGTSNTELYVNDDYDLYSWNTSSSDTLISITQSGNYWLLAESSKGCQGYSDTIQITVYELPTPEIAANNGFTFCADDSSTLSTKKSYSSYFWSSFSSNSSITVKKAGNYSVLVTDSNGCTGSDLVKINVNPRPAKFSIVNDYKNSFCSGDTAGLSSPSANAYLWNTGETQQKIEVTATDSYHVTIQNQFGCKRSDSLFIYVGVPSNLKTYNDTSFCLGDSFYVEADKGYSKYEWSTGQTTDFVSIKSSETLFLKTTDSIGCVFNTDTFYTNARPLQVPVPNASAGSVTEFCDGDSVILNASSGYARYEWSNGDNTQQTVVKSSGVYEVLVFDQNNCRGRSPEIEVTVFANPQPTLVYNTLDTCQGDTIFISTSNTYDKMLWSTQESSDTIAVVSSQNIALTVFDSNQCVGTISPVRAEIRPVPIFDIDTLFYSGICMGDSIGLRVEALSPITSIKWQDKLAGQRRTFYDNEAIFVRVFNRFGCSTVSDTINAVFKENPTPSISASRGDSFCADGFNTLSPRKDYREYLWSNGAKTKSIRIDSSGIYQVKVKDENGCSGIDSFRAYRLPVPKVELNLKDSSRFCANDSLKLASENRHFYYQWNNGEEDRFFYITKEGDYWLRAYNIYGCSSLSDTIWAESLELPTVELNRIDSASICRNDSLLLRTNQTFQDYSWSNGAKNAEIFIKSEGKFWVEATSLANGCSNFSDTFQLLIDELPQLEISAGSAAPYCEGDTVVLTANTNAKNIVWSNLLNTKSIEVANTGIYTVRVSDQNNCSQNDSVNIIFNRSPATPRISQKLNTLFAGTDAETYQWYFNDLPMGGGFEDTLEINAKGLYSLEASIGDCKVRSKEFYFAPLDSAGSLYFEAFPNPNNGVFHLNVDVFTLENTFLQILDSRGDLIYQQNLGKGNLNNVRIKTPELRQGIYLLRVKNGDDYKSRKMVIN